MRFSQTKTWYEHGGNNGCRSFDPLGEDTVVDVCIIGGGISGVIAALKCAEEGKSVALLEASSIAYGASGRGGNVLAGGVDQNFLKAESVLDSKTINTFYEIAFSARKDLARRIKEYNIDCSLSLGSFLVALNVPQRKTLKKLYKELLKRFSKTDDVELFTATQYHEKISSEGILSALLYKDNFSVHPIKLLYALLEESLAKGVRFYENSPVHHIVYGEPHYIHTERYAVKADDLIICGNAYMTEFSLPHETNASAVTRYYQWVSTPFSAEEAKRISRDREMVKTIETLPSYFQVTLDNRIIVGGPDYFFERNPQVLSDKIQKRIQKFFPALKGLKADYLWYGRYGVKMNVLPVFDELYNRVFVSHGVSGHGLLATYMSGLKLAEAALGQRKDFDKLAAIQVKPLPKALYHVFARIKVTWFKVQSYISMSLLNKY